MVFSQKQDSNPCLLASLRARLIGYKMFAGSIENTSPRGRCMFFPLAWHTVPIHCLQILICNHWNSMLSRLFRVLKRRIGSYLGQLSFAFCASVLLRSCSCHGATT